MMQLEREDTTEGELPQAKALYEKITSLVGGIDDIEQLERIYRFIKYIYIHKT